MHKTSANARRPGPIAGVSWTYIGTLVKTRDSCDRHIHGSQAIADTRGAEHFAAPQGRTAEVAQVQVGQAPLLRGVRRFASGVQGLAVNGRFFRPASRDQYTH